MAAVAVRLAIVFVLGLHLQPFRAEIQRTALSLVTTGVFGNEYAVPTGPTAHVSPLHTWLVASAFWLFGTDTAGELAQYIFNIVLAGLVYAYIPVMATRLGLPRMAGVAAGWFGALVPFHYLNEIRSGDAPLSALALMGVLATAVWLIDRRPVSRWQSLIVGLSWGFALLVLPTLLFVIASVTALGVWTHRNLQFVASAGLAAAVAAMLLAPWAIRNRVALGEFVWSRSNSGIELRLAFNDQAFADVDRNVAGGAWARYHPLANPVAAQQLRDEGELNFNRRMRQETAAWVRANPGRALGLVMERTLYFWFPRTDKPLQALFLSALSVLSLSALPLLWRRYRTAGTLFLVTWATFPLAYYLVHAAIRYRYPMMWTILLAGATLVLGLFIKTPHAEAPRD